MKGINVFCILAALRRGTQTCLSATGKNSVKKKRLKT